MEAKRISEDNWPKCSQANCELPALYTYVWDRDMYGCAAHTHAALNIASAMGFPTVQNTLKLLFPVGWEPPTGDEPAPADR